MNGNSNIEMRLSHYEHLMYNYFMTGEMHVSDADDSLTGYLYRVLSDPSIQEKLKDDLMQQFFMQQMMYFFRYVLMQAEMSGKVMTENVWEGFERRLADEMNRIGSFLASRQVSAGHFKEMIELTAGRGWNEQDYVVVQDIKDTCQRYAVLDEIVCVMGRIVGNGADCMPVKESRRGKSRRVGSSDIVGIGMGNDIKLALPSELVCLTSPLLETVFWKKWADSQLQLFHRRSVLPVRSARQGTKERTAQGGAMIVCVDTSGSMFGRKEQIAKGMAWKLLKMARKQKRPLFLITFSVRVRCVDATRLLPGEFYRNFLGITFSGGTSCLHVLSKALEVLRTERFSWADVLFISDFEFDKCPGKLQKVIAEAQRNGTAFYGLQFGKGYNVLHGVFDKIWQL